LQALSLPQPDWCIYLLAAVQFQDRLFAQMCKNADAEMQPGALKLESNPKLAGIFRPGHRAVCDLAPDVQTYQDAAANAAALVFQSDPSAPPSITSGRSTGRLQFATPPFGAERQWPSAMVLARALARTRIVLARLGMLKFEHRAMRDADCAKWQDVVQKRRAAVLQRPLDVRHGSAEAPKLVDSAWVAIEAVESTIMRHAAEQVVPSHAEAAEIQERLEERLLLVRRTLRPRGVLGVRDTAGLVASVHGTLSLLIRDTPSLTVGSMTSAGKGLLTNVRLFTLSGAHAPQTTKVRV
jgi:hypothetical protein